ncbi:MAG TPA: transporter associated domain-containing protein [Orrella sp.]
MPEPYPSEPGQAPGDKSKSKKSLVDRILSLVRGEPEDREGIFTVLEAARERELIDSNAYTMLKGALAVSDQTAADIMVPRARMDLLDVNEPLASLLPKIVEMAHSRFPVYEDSPDNLIGIFMTKDLLRHMLNPTLTLRDLVRPAVFIPETKRVNVLLQEFRSHRNHIAIVIDEHGGITGLVTLEDVLEQIVGAIEDEYDDSEQTIFPDGHNTWRILATTELEHISELLHCEIPEGDYDTLGGWLAHELGRIPRRGDRHALEDLQFEVLRADSRRAIWVRARRLPHLKADPTALA